VKYTAADGTVKESGTNYTYADADTPKITSLDPDVGVTSGGTVVTVTGANLGSTPADITIVVDGK
jgi:hypothetical protein